MDVPIQTPGIDQADEDLKADGRQDADGGRDAVDQDDLGEYTLRNPANADHPAGDPDGGAEEQAILADIAAWLPDYSARQSNLIPVLQKIQEKHRYIPTGAITLVAGHLGLSPGEVYGVATFYNQFRFNPPGKYPVKVCLGTACLVRGADVIL